MKTDQNKISVDATNVLVIRSEVDIGEVRRQLRQRIDAYFDKVRDTKSTWTVDVVRTGKPHDIDGVCVHFKELGTYLYIVLPFPDYVVPKFEVIP